MSTNKWSRRWVDLSLGDDRNERALAQMEADQSDALGSYSCPKEGCNGKCYHRPGVGGWWCDTCNQLDRS